jgi:hypothetical protein
MAKITEEMVHQAYLTAKQVWRGSIGRTMGISEIARLSAMGRASAGDYITAFLAMMDGKLYHRCISFCGTKYFLLQIGEDFGLDAQKRAALAVKKHVDYYRQKHAYLAKTDQLADSFLP